MLRNHLPFVRISHLLDFDPWFDGICDRRFSNRSFISLRRFRSAILWLTRSAGVRLYGVAPSSAIGDSPSRPLSWLCCSVW